jgi:hypothetical protein
MRWPYPRTPSIGRDLPPKYDEGERVFDERVKAEFPIGSSEARLIKALRSQGFPPASSTDMASATITRGLIMKTIWSVRWRAKEDRIEDIWGVYGGIAP